MTGPQTTLSKIRRPNTFLPVESCKSVIMQATSGTLWTVISGFVLLILILIIGIKIKVLWILLPLSLYLIGQLFVYTNHVRTAKDQQIFYDPKTGEVLVDYIKKTGFAFNIKHDVVSVNEVRSIQKNKGIVFGYYKLNTKNGVVILPYLLEQNKSEANNLFFQQIHTHKRAVETKLFAII